MTAYSLQDKLYRQEGEQNDILMQWDRQFDLKVKATGKRFDDHPVLWTLDKAAPEIPTRASAPKQ